jgi:hypothetical protein
MKTMSTGVINHIKTWENTKKTKKIMKNNYAVAFFAVLLL